MAIATGTKIVSKVVRVEHVKGNGVSATFDENEVEAILYFARLALRKVLTQNAEKEYREYVAEGKIDPSSLTASIIRVIDALDPISNAWRDERMSLGN